LTAFGRWVAETGSDWPAPALEAARLQYIDLIGVAIAGAREDVSRLTHSAIARWGGGNSTVIGRPDGLAPPWAALANGTAAHALDFDDNFDPAKAHASAVLIPAILALAEERPAPGFAVLDAYIVGLQIMGRVGQGINPFHRNRGWHATATVGAIGAAAACGRLLALSSAQATHALSLATSMAAGSMAQFGTMAKPLHAGLAAKAGVMAASLAQAGLNAGTGTLDGPYGINRLMVGPDYEELRDAIRHIEHGQTMRFSATEVGEPLLILSDGFRVKRFANCGSAHRAMDALLELIERHGFGADDVEQVTVSAPVSHLNNLKYDCPETVLEAKFSLEFGLAVLLRTGQCRLTDFSPEMIASPSVRALYSRIARVPIDAAEGVFPTRVHVRLRGGEEHTAVVAMPAGSHAAPFPEEAYWSKFEACLSYAEGAGAFKDLKSTLLALEKLPDIRALTQHLRFPLP